MRHGCEYRMNIKLNIEKKQIILNKSEVVTLDKKRFAKMGPDTVIIIPRTMTKYNIINKDKLYNIYLEEVKDDK